MTDRLPEPVLVTAMAKHERFFPVRDSHGALTNRFVSIRNGGREDAVKRGTLRVGIGRGGTADRQGDAAVLPLAGKADAGAGIDARRNASIQPSLFDLAAGAAAIGALVADDLAFASAGGASGLDAEEALRLHDLAVTVAVIAFRGRRSRLRSGAVARSTEFSAFDLDLARAAFGRFEQINRQ